MRRVQSGLRSKRQEHAQKIAKLLNSVREKEASLGEEVEPTKAEARCHQVYLLIIDTENMEGISFTDISGPLPYTSVRGPTAPPNQIGEHLGRFLQRVCRPPVHRLNNIAATEPSAYCPPLRPRRPPRIRHRNRPHFLRPHRNCHRPHQRPHPNQLEAPCALSQQHCCHGTVCQPSTVKTRATPVDTSPQ